MGLLLNGVGVLVTKDTEKEELLNAFFASDFTAKASPQESQALETKKKSRERMTFHWLKRIRLKII